MAILPCLPFLSFGSETSQSFLIYHHTSNQVAQCSGCSISNEAVHETSSSSRNILQAVDIVMKHEKYSHTANHPKSTTLHHHQQHPDHRCPEHSQPWPSLFSYKLHTHDSEKSGLVSESIILTTYDRSLNPYTAISSRPPPSLVDLCLFLAPLAGSVRPKKAVRTSGLGTLTWDCNCGALHILSCTI